MLHNHILGYCAPNASLSRSRPPDLPLRQLNISKPFVQNSRFPVSFAAGLTDHLRDRLHINFKRLKEF